jgi:hypothetical protein
MALSVVFDGTALHTEPNGPYLISDPENGPDWGSQAVGDALQTGQLRPDEVDQAAAELGLQRVVVLPLKIRASTADTLVTLQQALTASLGKSSKYAPTTLTVTPNNSTHVSTFKVWGGSWTSAYNQAASVTNTIHGTLTLQCFWPVFGAAQNLGSSGAPLISNTASPAAVTLTPNPVGDIPADVILYVKNRSASAIRSLTAAVVSGNTTWVINKLATAWSAGANGSLGGSLFQAFPADATTILAVASFTTPVLPTDRRFRIMLRNTQVLGTASSAPSSFRVRVVTGSTEVVGEWRTPPALNAVTIQPFVADMGGFMIPVSEVGSLGAGSTTTTVFVDARGNDLTGSTTSFAEALFLPDDSTVVVETSDTGKTLAAAAATIQLETDQVYDSSGNAAGGVVQGSQLRILGSSRVYVYTSQQYMGNMNAGAGYAPENVDVYATVTPRFVGLA